MKRIESSLERLKRICESLDELEQVLEERRRQDRNPLFAYLEGEHAVAVEVSPELEARTGVTPLAIRRRKKRIKRAVERTANGARMAVLPLMLAASLTMFGLVRLQPANTLWYQELTITSEVETGEFKCEPIQLLFVGLTHPEAGKTTLTYALSGGGAQGFGCPEHNISNFSIPLGTCYNPEVKQNGPVIGETHPGGSAWKYDPKNTKNGNPSLAKWDAQTEQAPYGGKGPFDPTVMRFTLTYNVEFTEAQLVEVMAKWKAKDETDAGKVKVPACPLPEPAKLKVAGPQTSTVAPQDAPQDEQPVEEEKKSTPVEDPTPTPLPEKKLPDAMTDGKPEPPKPTPSPTPKPVGVAVYPGGSR